MARFLLIAAVGFGFLAGISSYSQTDSKKEPGRPVIRTTSREVVLDLVVRDKHQHAVTDLHPDEVEVYEDGVRQNIRVFRSIQGSEQLQTERSAEAGRKTVPAEEGERPSALNSLRQVNFVSVVFADIAPLNLEFARRAIQEFLRSDTLPNTYVTIYRLNRSLVVIQPYTRNKELLAQAANKAAKGLNIQSASGGTVSAVGAAVDEIRAQGEMILAAPATGAATAQSVENELNNPLPALVKDPMFAANAASQDASFNLGSALIAQADLAQALRFATNLSNGMDAMDSLHALVKSEENLPGRKIVLYLADGITFPMNRRDAVANLISYANRSGVSFYTVDTRGLNVDDPMMESLSAQRRAGSESLIHNVDPLVSHKEGDDIELAAVGNSQLSMRELAEATGGFAVTNTNEIALPMQRMMEDIRTHYELAYAPTSSVYDGHFRRIEVKVNRPKVTVQTRTGYYAVPDVDGEPLQPYELVALNALNVQPAPTAFPYQFAAMKFRPEQQGAEYEMAFEVPFTGLKPVTDQKTGVEHFQAAMVAFVHDASGNVIRKVSREVAREIPQTARAQIGGDRILYAEPVDLPAGHYLIDAAVTDEPSGKTSVKRVSVFVDSAKNLSVSSLELVRRFEPLSGPRNPANPFDLENGRITPTLADSVTAGLPMSLYFVVYPGKAATAEETNVTLELLRDGKAIARKPLRLSAPQADGSIPMVVELSPGPGQCDVLVTARQGEAIAQSTLSVRIE